MIKKLLFLIISISSAAVYSQINFESGYYIDNAGKKVAGEIKNIDWRNNPTEFEFRNSAEAAIQLLNISEVQEFGITDISKYVRFTVDIDRSKQGLNDMSTEKNPVYNSEILFLKVLIEGGATLYEYVGADTRNYFYQTQKDALPQQLIYKTYKTSELAYATNSYFRQQIWNDMKCSDITLTQIERTDYTKRELTRLFEAYNKCMNFETTNFARVKNVDVFKLTPRVHFNNTSLSVQYSNSDLRDANFGSKISFAFGIESEFILPFNKNKWSVIVEPVYQNFKSSISRASSSISGGTLHSDVDYRSIDLAVGGRHHFFLNPRSTIFIDAAYVVTFDMKSSVTYTRNDGTTLSDLEIKSKNNFVIGAGYKYDRYSAQARFSTKRELFEYLRWTSNYNTISLVLGYTIL